MSIDYSNLLYEKAQKEFDEYKHKLMQMPQEEVFSHSYETVIKQDLLCIFKNEEFLQIEEKALYKLKNPLDACYQEWLKNDYSHMDMLRDAVDDRAKSAIKEMKEKNKESR